MTTTGKDARGELLGVLTPQDSQQVGATSLPARLAWISEQGLDASNLMRIEVRTVDGQFVADVAERLRNDEGHAYCGIDHDHGADRDQCKVATRVLRVPLSTLPPELVAPSPKPRRGRGSKGGPVS